MLGCGTVSMSGVGTVTSGNARRYQSAPAAPVGMMRCGLDGLAFTGIKLAAHLLESQGTRSCRQHQAFTHDAAPGALKGPWAAWAAAGLQRWGSFCRGSGCFLRQRHGVGQQQTRQACGKEWQTPQQDSKRRNKKGRQSLPQEKRPCMARTR
jgi:hypothetical protein